MRFKGFILGVVILFSFSQELFAQKETAKIYVRPRKDSIELRWQIYDAAIWNTNIRRGYDLYRKNPDGQTIKLNDTAIKAYDPYQFALRYLKTPPPIDTTGIDENNAINRLPKDADFKFAPDTIARTAMILQFPKEVGLNFQMPTDANLDFGDNPDKVRWLFHSITCLSSKEAAIVSGLYFSDKKILKEARYTYYLTNHGEGIDKALATVTASSTDSYPMRKPVELDDVTNKKRAALSWKKADTTIVYLPTYNIYRSESKNGTYKKLNSKDILAVISGTWDSTKVSFMDSTLEKKKTYYYKVKGKDLFGEETPFSDPYVVTEKTLMEYTPYIGSASRVDNPIGAKINWSLDEKEEDNISSFQVYYSTQMDTLFKPATGILKKDIRTYTYKTPSKNNYFKVMAIGNAGDTLWSQPAYVLIPDSIAPLPPVILNAVCDSNGVVTITWKDNNEPDLFGYKIFRANFEHEEFSGFLNKKGRDTTYRDTVKLKVLDESLYYKMIVYDDSYNTSEFSNVFKSKRYDVIAPTHPVFTNFINDKNGVLLTWANSSSTDVIKTILYRKLRDESTWHEHKVFVRDTAAYSTFRDTTAYKGQWYEYALQAFDDDKLASGFSPSIHMKVYDDGIRPEIKTITEKHDVRKGIVKISWKYKEAGVEHFQIYRGENDGKVAILKSLDPNVFEFYDKEVVSGKKYRYRIKAVFKDGAESLFSREIVVQF